MLELRNVVAGYGATRVLRGVDLTVPSGSVVALLGANGAGKTTLLRVAAGLLRPESGHLLVNDQDVTGLAPHKLVERGVCHVPEGRGIFGSLTVRENLVVQSRRGEETASVEQGGVGLPRPRQTPRAGRGHVVRR